MPIKAGKMYEELDKLNKKNSADGLSELEIKSLKTKNAKK